MSRPGVPAPCRACANRIVTSESFSRFSIRQRHRSDPAGLRKMSQSASCRSSPAGRENSDRQAFSLSEEINLLKSFLMEPTRADRRRADLQHLLRLGPV